MRCSRSLMFLLLAALGGAVSSPAQTLDLAAEEARAPAGNPVLPGIWRLEGTDPDLPHGDLEPLRQLVGKAQVVALGETVHTSGGYYEMKHRIFRFLVERMGFRVFAIESDWEPAEQVSRYVATCAGDAEAAVEAGLFGVWASREVLALVEWMCEWNRSHRKPKDRVHFVGFDIQQPELDGPALIAFLERIGVPEDDPRSAGLRACEGVERSFYPAPIPEELYRQCTAALQGVEELFSRNAAAIVRQTSKADFEWAKIRAVGLKAWEDQLWYPDGRSYTARDIGMAYTFQAIRALRFPRAKVMVWAHNSHISRAPHPLNGGLPMGSILARTLGRNYVNLGLAAFETGIDWPGMGCGPQRLEGNSVEQRFHDLNEGDLLVDLVLPGGAPHFLPPGLYALGNRPMDPRQHFDGLVYLERSPKMTPLRWLPCQP